MLKKAAILTSAAAAATFALAPLAHAADGGGKFNDNNVNVDTQVSCENGSQNPGTATSPLTPLIGVITGSLGSAKEEGDHQNQTLSPYVNKCANQKGDD
jgi:hypothetical protein